MKVLYKKLKIELKSGLCAASGFSYAGVIDSDISYNKNGIPYISGRRLKGCMKEAAEMLGIDNDILEKIFGKNGNNDISGITIGDAYPCGWLEINKSIDKLNEDNIISGGYINQQSILELFTTIKAQTEIEKEIGVAKENSLRFTRIVEKNNPIDGKNMVFEADISLSTEEKETGNIKIENIEKELEKIIKATRHIGYMRNRGMGNVKIELENNNDKPETGIEDDNSNTPENKKYIDKSSKGEGKVKITYRIRNNNPLMLSGSSDSCSESYINGTSVMGVFAKEYLKDGTPNDKEFLDLFLNGTTIYSNLTLTKKWDDKYWVDYYPVPLYINELKKTKKLVNIAVPRQENTEEDMEYSTQNGNQQRKLKGKMLGEYKNETEDKPKSIFDVCEPQKEIIYHYSKEKKKNTDDGTLYYLEVLEAGQCFSGSIITDKKYKEIILTILNKGVFFFGKSKSAQYGLCQIEQDSIIIEDYKYVSQINANAEETIIVTLLSDGIFIDEDGIYTVNSNEIRKYIGKSIGLEEENINTDSQYAYLQTKEITGYNTVWNLKKQAVPAVKAGSAVLFKIKKGADIKYTEYIGEKNGEGFGQCKITRLSDCNYKMRNKKDEEEEQEINNKPEIPECLKPVIEKILINRLSQQLGNKASDDGNLIKITSSALGRMQLMLAEAENDKRVNSGLNNSGNALYYADVLEDFLKRVNSIKSNETREEAEDFLLKVIGCKYDKDKGLLQDSNKKIDKKNLYKTVTGKIILKRDGEDKTANMDEYQYLEKIFGKDNAEKLAFSLWAGYLHNILVYQQYWKKEEV